MKGITKALLSSLLFTSFHRFEVDALGEDSTNNERRGGKIRRLFGAWRNGNRNNSNSSIRERDLYYNDYYAAQAQGYYDYANEGNNDDAADDDDRSNYFKANSLCTQYLFSFLEGTTDAKDNCEGIENAYDAAYCSNLEEGADDDHDDYFNTYNHISCCQSLKEHYNAYCDEMEIITNMHLLLVASVLLFCEMAKSLIKSNKIHWIPEAGGCIMVGTLFGFVASFHIDLDNLSFNEDLFLCILLPPIIFEAALAVNKKEFRRRRLAILMFAVIGTIISTFMTGYIVHYGSAYFTSATTIPLLDSIIFGALISSVDPVAILSVLTSLNLTEKDTIFIMVFGESLLNDGVSITLFKTLLRHYDTESSGVTIDEVLGTIADFFIVGVGSIVIGMICGFAALIYFWVLRKKLNPSMEVASFFLWAGIPYYICDECNLSGIVAIVTIGFFMDIYIAKPNDEPERRVGEVSSTYIPKPIETNVLVNPNNGIFSLSKQIQYPLREAASSHYVDLGDSTPCDPDNLCGMSPSGRSLYSLKSFRSLRTLNMREIIMREERFRLTVEADRHVRFVAHLLSSLSENCIFVYLGLFIFSKQYIWDWPLIGISIFSCVISRAVMVVVVCFLVWHINILRQWCGCYKPTHLTVEDLETGEPPVSRTAVALQDPKIQLVLVLAGLRGAVSLALVESVPIYNGVTGSGSNYKGQMKGMTSASIIFTIFVIGGSAFYILRSLNIASDDQEETVQTKTTIPKKKSWKDAPKPEVPMRKPQFTSLSDIS